MKRFYNLLLLIVCCVFLYSNLQSQINYTANDFVREYEGHFRFGMNQGYFPPWNDQQLAEIAAGNPDRNIPGVGVKALRPSLPEWLMEIYGYDFRKKTYEFYETLGITDHTVIVEGPADWHRDLYNYCGNGNDNDKSRLFANLYSPIWDNGENGTPVNDTNYLALYLYKTASIYKDHIKFYEIWNEPDFFFFGNIWNYRDPQNTWWVRNPDPCEYQLHAPIFHYVRTLRISYEVIKYVDPDAYVSIGALGMPHFLDAVLRNTDNPIDGTATDEFPLRGGAYFDVMGYHEYPHIDGSLWTYDYRFDSGPKDFLRNSDRAVNNGIFRKKREFENVLYKYGYDGNTYPEKIWIITESNVPRKHFNDARYYGSDEMQRNYIIKAAIGAMKEDIVQFHPFTLGDKQTAEDASYEFDLMGMYKKLGGTNPYTQEVNDVGIAYKTVSDMLYKTKFDIKKTTEMELPEEIDGGAFEDEEGNYIYALWAKTNLDKSEDATATYSFPNDFEIDSLKAYPWNWSYHNEMEYFSQATDIQLTGSPVFFKVAANICNCDGDYTPVCGTDGQDYSNACQAACAGVDYERGTCASNTGDMDLEITNFSASQDTFHRYDELTIYLEIHNNGTRTARDIEVEFNFSNRDLAYIEDIVSKGNLDIRNKTWTIDELIGNERARVEITVLATAETAISLYTQLTKVAYEDIDSTPNNGDRVSAREDDEAALTLTYVNLDNTTSTRQIGLTNFTLRPNPTTTQLVVEFESWSEILDISIVDLHGKKWSNQQQQWRKGTQLIEFDVADFPSGVYILAITTEKGVANRLFVKD